MTDHIIFIAGAGQSKKAWDKVTVGMHRSYTTHTFAATDLLPPGAKFSIKSCTNRLYDYMAQNSIKRATLCGLSLGAMIATDFTVHHPQQVKQLVLCGSQVKPNSFLMLLQTGIMRLLSERLLGLPPELTKRQLLDILHESSKVDFSEDLSRIKVPTLVVCGSGDRLNLSASKYLAEHIDDVRLRIISDSGHQINIDNPKELQRVILSFLEKPTKILM